jgi:hypothetical protein
VIPHLDLLLLRYEQEDTALDLVCSACANTNPEPACGYCILGGPLGDEELVAAIRANETVEW